MVSISLASSWQEAIKTIERTAMPNEQKSPRSLGLGSFVSAAKVAVKRLLTPRTVLIAEKFIQMERECFDAEVVQRRQDQIESDKRIDEKLGKLLESMYEEVRKERAAASHPQACAEHRL